MDDWRKREYLVGVRLGKRESGVGFGEGKGQGNMLFFS